MNAPSIHRSFSLLLAAAVAGASLLAGCGYLRHTRDNVEPKAVPAMKMAQTLNPEAGNNRKVVAGLNGAAAVKVSDAYVKSFEKTAPPARAAETFIGLSGLSGN